MAKKANAILQHWGWKIESKEEWMKQLIFFQHKWWGVCNIEFDSVLCAVQGVLTHSAPSATAEFVYHIAVEATFPQDTLCMLWLLIQAGLQSSRRLCSRAHWPRLELVPLNVYLDFPAAISSLLPNPIKTLAAVWLSNANTNTCVPDVYSCKSVSVNLSSEP